MSSKIEELEKIDSHEELEKKNEYLKNNPYSPNKILFNGVPSIIWNNKCVDLRKVKAVEDYFHKGFFFPVGHGKCLYKIIKSWFDRTPFRIDDQNTWLRLDYEKLNDGSYYLETSDMDMYYKSVKGLLTQYNGMEEVFVFHTDEELEALGFVKGTVNSKFWFHKEEVKHLDKMLPYKKFDHIIWKTDIKQLERELRVNGESPEQIKREITEAINNNIKFGVDSITYKQFEGIKYTFGRRKIS